MNHLGGRSTGYLKLLCGLAVAVLLCVPPVLAQSANQGKNDAIYLDRDQRLLDAARQEGAVVVYTSLATKESTPLARAFEKKYAIKVELWRATSDKVVQRTITEGQARRFAVDGNGKGRSASKRPMPSGWRPSSKNWAPNGA